MHLLHLDVICKKSHAILKSHFFGKAILAQKCIGLKLFDRDSLYSLNRVYSLMTCVFYRITYWSTYTSNKFNLSSVTDASKNNNPLGMQKKNYC